MLWVRREGREYVIRDEEVLRQARAAWQDFNEKQLGQLVSEQVSGQIEAMEKFSQDSRLVSEAGQLGAQIGASAVEMAMRVLENLNIDEIDLDGLNELKELKQLKHLKGLKDLEQLKHLEELKELEGLHESMRHLHEELRDVHEQVRHEVDHSMREGLERHREQLHERQRAPSCDRAADARAGRTVRRDGQAPGRDGAGDRRARAARDGGDAHRDRSRDRRRAGAAGEVRAPSPHSLEGMSLQAGSIRFKSI